VASHVPQDVQAEAVELLAVYMFVGQASHKFVEPLRNLPAAQPQTVLTVAEHAVTVAGSVPEQVVQAVGQPV